ncbi:MAG TPA: hypothetical protein VHW68_08705 [Actinomycetota bacterium]|jgi:hypothetical protein|nr:hypothetical protein [Actinomycetota bacterium]
MDTTTQVTRVSGSHVSPSRRWLVAGIAALALAGGIAVGRATAAEPAAPATPAFTAVSVAPGHTQPATTIHRITMQATSQQGG